MEKERDGNSDEDDDEDDKWAEIEMKEGILEF